MDWIGMDPYADELDWIGSRKNGPMSNSDTTVQ